MARRGGAAFLGLLCFHQGPGGYAGSLKKRWLAARANAFPLHNPVMSGLHYFSQLMAALRFAEDWFSCQLQCRFMRLESCRCAHGGRATAPRKSTIPRKLFTIPVELF
ncbi:hypothetical protein DKP76_15620 [Falsochrobactrum shanghaiense]|uniref:Uncharacterized protein n=1 Tax=Falsochrobactrum shanghaiense TaxID=2201899 RepID=A0A316J6W2_9HYPH|nr:hypothetical protein DKP76_15620 [Falsochrobactrum shanghaiense]